VVFVLAVLLALFNEPPGADAQVSVTGEWRLLPQTAPINPIHVGSRTLVAQVRDAANNGGQDARSFTVQNAGSGLAASFTARRRAPPSGAP
jgi:hypothetical protein